MLIDRPRLRGKDNKEIQLSTYKAFQNPMGMNSSAMKQMILGISSRNYEKAVESFIKGYGIKKYGISRHFVKATAEQMREFMERDLSELELCAIFIDVPPEHQEAIDARPRAAYNMADYEDAKKSLDLTVRYLERLNPSAAASLMKGWRRH